MGQSLLTVLDSKLYVRFNQENEDGSKSNETPSGGQTVGDVGHVTNKTVTWADVVAGNSD